MEICEADAPDKQHIRQIVHAKVLPARQKEGLTASALRLQPIAQLKYRLHLNVNIQRHWRGYHVRRNWRRYCDEVVRIQAAWRMAIASKRWARQARAIVQIQALGRGGLQRIRNRRRPAKVLEGSSSSAVAPAAYKKR
jgi:hypothetical protein